MCGSRQTPVELIGLTGTNLYLPFEHTQSRFLLFPSHHIVVSIKGLNRNQEEKSPMLGAYSFKITLLAPHGLNFITDSDHLEIRSLKAQTGSGTRDEERKCKNYAPISTGA